jgi:hypothetical protein
MNAEEKPKCQVCGRFISFDDIESGNARHIMVKPDSHVSYEEWETLCPKHITPPASGV